MPKGSEDGPRTPRLPPWAAAVRKAGRLHAVKSLLRASGLSTVCEEARCPNISGCFARSTATFLILGDVCTRACLFCGVRKGRPSPPEPGEAERLAGAVSALGLRHAVITSVTRDDLPDKGALAFARTIRAVRAANPSCTVEVLTPDFMGREDLLAVVLAERPDVFAHNVETVGRLHGVIRPGADLYRSISLLAAARAADRRLRVKSGFMVGLGEDEAEIEGLLGELSGTGCDMVTIGQYLRPSKDQAPVRRYWEPEAFERWGRLAKTLGIGYCVAGPLVRSSYRAREALEALQGADRADANAKTQKENGWKPSV